MQTFFCEEDYRYYMALMAEWCGRCDVDVWAYCLMPNPVHTVRKSGNATLTIAEQRMENGTGLGMAEMKDRLGKFLMEWRFAAVAPEVQGRLLDIGCGTNQFTKRFKPAGVGVDVHQWGSVDMVVEDTAKLPLESESFDTVSILAALNHIPNREAVLAEAYRVLKPGGRIVITMIPPGVSRVWHFVRKPWDADQSERGMKAGEVYGLTPTEVRRRIEDAGFRIFKERRFMLGINRITVGVKPSKGD